MIVGLGTDIIEVSRVKKFAEDKDMNKLQRIFTLQECEYAFLSHNKFERLAARFAVKEAFFKAFGSGIFAEIEVLHDDNKKPYISLKGDTYHKWLEKGKPEIIVSLSHTKDYAFATVILQK